MSDIYLWIAGYFAGWFITWALLRATPPRQQEAP